MAQKALETLEHIHASRYKEARKAITTALDKRKDNAQYASLFVNEFRVDLLFWAQVRRAQGSAAHPLRRGGGRHGYHAKVSNKDIVFILHLIVCSLKAKNVDDAFVTEVIIECMHEIGELPVYCPSYS